MGAMKLFDWIRYSPSKVMLKKTNAVGRFPERLQCLKCLQQGQYLSRMFVQFFSVNIIPIINEPIVNGFTLRESDGIKRP